MITNKTKRTLFFYFAIAALVLLLIMGAYYVITYNQQINSYIQNGYDRATVVNYMPFFSSILPSWSSLITSYGLLAAVLFAADAIIVTLKKTVPEEENVFEEIMVEKLPEKKEDKQETVTDEQEQ